VAVPWDLSGITEEVPEGSEPLEPRVDESRMTPEQREELSIKRQVEDRRKEMMSEHDEEIQRIDQEFAEANDAYGY